ncbi:hypothetical protein [Planktomarina sp.]|jgi:hypothetical protein|uniref:hypothetical protein n=1 Tax=Planktomarina sp. TaxID=2024851 RepID=UPI003261A427
MPSGGYRPGAGRKPKPKDPNDGIESSVTKMKRLKIDPIDILNKELKALQGKEDSKSQNLRVRIAEKLLEYGYSKQPVSLHNTGLANVPMLTIVSKINPEIKQANVVEHEISTSEDSNDKEVIETH